VSGVWFLWNLKKRAWLKRGFNLAVLLFRRHIYPSIKPKGKNFFSLAKGDYAHITFRRSKGRHFLAVYVLIKNGPIYRVPLALPMLWQLLRVTHVLSPIRFHNREQLDAFLKSRLSPFRKMEKKAEVILKERGLEVLYEPVGDCED